MFKEEFDRLIVFNPEPMDGDLMRIGALLVKDNYRVKTAVISYGDVSYRIRVPDNMLGTDFGAAAYDIIVPFEKI